MSDHKAQRHTTVGELGAGHFRIAGTVGKGAMGAVYPAEHVGTGQRVAVKFMVIDGDPDPEPGQPPSRSPMPTSSQRPWALGP